MDKITEELKEGKAIYSIINNGKIVKQCDFNEHIYIGIVDEDNGTQSVALFKNLDFKGSYTSLILQIDDMINQCKDPQFREIPKQKAIDDLSMRINELINCLASKMINKDEKLQ